MVKNILSISPAYDHKLQKDLQHRPIRIWATFFITGRAWETKYLATDGGRYKSK